ncbi:MAG: hypothetical protein OEV91_04385, partial [Desulfobulbaceae bacterium]|nr:hypothetical protein [Desulfobulbaceae bacterium]
YDGHRINGNIPATMDSMLSGTVDAAAMPITSGQLLINGIAPADITADAGDPVNGLNMGTAANAWTEINAISDQSGVTAHLTTLVAGGPAGATVAGGNVSFLLNGTRIDVTIPAGQTATQAAGLISDEVNRLSSQTGISATVGDGATNGGVADAVVLKNNRSGNESPIVISALSETGDAVSGLANGTSFADSTHNTGQISFSSAKAFELSTDPAIGDDTILSALGLAGGGLGFADDTGDGEIIFGSRLAIDDLKVNGYSIGATEVDGLSNVYADASAAAKATAINLLSGQSGVTATVVPAYVTASGPVAGATTNGMLTARMDIAGIMANTLKVNGTDLGAIAPGTSSNGLFMDKAVSARDAIVAADPSITVRLTTLYAGGAATAESTDGSDSTIDFSINGIAVNSITVPDGTDAAGVAALTVNAINKVGEYAGVMAFVGDGTNGGAVNSVVIRNTPSGNETNIVVSGLTELDSAKSGLTNGTYTADNSAPDGTPHNTGEISMSSSSPFSFSTNMIGITPPDDRFLDHLGIGGGNMGINDITDDGSITFDGTTPVQLSVGDLLINGVNIFDDLTRIPPADADNTVVNAINAKADQTGIYASRTSDGTLLLTAKDGRNIHIQTSPQAEMATNINNGTGEKVYFGSIQLSSDKEFMLETTPTPVASYEKGLEALGMSGGANNSGEPGDIAADGEIWVRSIANQDGNVRYTGDRDHDGEVRLSKGSSLAVTTRGNEALSDTGVFAALKNLENSLRGENFSEITSSYAANDTTVTLNSGNTGLEKADELIPGKFTVTVTDYDYYPPRDFAVAIPVDPAVDTLETMAQKLNGIPGLNASWDGDGRLQIATTNGERYKVKFDNDSSGFLDAVGIDSEDMQIHALQNSIAEMDQIMDNLTSQISDFGARANRIEVQGQILINLELAGTERLSEQQDTDIVKALMELKGKEFAYEAALSAAAKTMQLSLVNYL